MKKILIFIQLSIVMSLNYSCSRHTETKQENPFLVDTETAFGVPPFDKIKVEHYMPAFKEAIRLHTEEIEQITNQAIEPTFENTIAAFDSSGLLLKEVSNVFELLAAADITPQMQAIQGDVASLLAWHADAIYLNQDLFARIETIYSQRDTLPLDAIQLRLVEKIRKDFVRAGSLLDDQQKEQIKAINQELTLAGVEFAQNLLEENKSFELVVKDRQLLGGLTNSSLDLAASTATSMGKEGQWVFRLNKPSLIPFLTRADNESLRLQLYEGYVNRANNNNEFDNKAIIKRIFELRAQRAEILGYESHAHYVLELNMAKTPEQVYQMLDDIWAYALDAAKDELAQMAQIKKNQTGSSEFLPSDWWYYAEKLRRQEYSLNEDLVRPYFALDNVRVGIFDLSNRLYGITFRPIHVPLYNKECEAYEVLDRDGSHLAVIYFDFFPRDGKGAGAWCGNFRDQRYIGDQRISPVVSIVCNFARPTKNTPSLLSLEEVETLFHEFGHALHSFFSDVKYMGLAEVERDFVELPSQIMENWALDPVVLKEYAVHYRSNEPISDDLINKISNGSFFNQGFSTVEYLAAAYLDMDIHSITDYENLDINAFEVMSLNKNRGLIEQIMPRYRYSYFSHLFDFDYSAGYYSYIWAEVLDKDAFAAFKESGNVFDQDIAAAFRRSILSQGGQLDGMDMYRAFRGQDATVEALMRSRGFYVEPEEEVEELEEDMPEAEE